MQELNHLDRHFILYSKNHYKRVNDPLVDLAKIIEKSCALPDGYSNDYKAFEVLSETFTKVALPFMFQDFFKRLFCKLGTLKISEANYKYAGELMLGQLSILPIRDSGEMILDIGEADPLVWPIKE